LHSCSYINHCCLNAGEQTIPCTGNSSHNSRVIPGWSERVAPLREKSLFWHNVWREADKPHSGVVASIMRETRMKYHRAIREVIREGDTIRKEKFAESVLGNNSRDFWNEVKKMRGRRSNLPGVVDDCSGDADIAQCFGDKYRDLYSSVPYNVDEISSLKQQLNDDIKLQCESSNAAVDAGEVYNAIRRLNMGKSDGTAGLSSDHFLYANCDLSVHLSMLIAGLINHGCIPEELAVSTVIPIPKSRTGGLAVSDNYRGICLSSIICKIIDLVILNRYVDNLSTSQLQFGFKAGRSTNMCTLLVKETISYYTNNSGSVYCCMLDATKAFDRVNYSKLFGILIDRKLPSVFVRFLLNMYTGHQTRVRWNGCFSDFIDVNNGVKQGGILSPILFCVYLDTLILKLVNSGVGCYMGHICLSVLAYADDLVLLAPSASAMRRLLSICDEFANEFDVKFNASKSKCMFFHPVGERSYCRVKPVFT